MKEKTSWILLITLTAAVFLSACGAKQNEMKTETVGGLMFDISKLTEEPTFIDWMQNGTAMQLIALKAGDKVRLAFNTCQSCQGSPWAWFEYLGDGNRDPETVEGNGFAYLEQAELCLPVLTLRVRGNDQ